MNKKKREYYSELPFVLHSNGVPAGTGGGMTKGEVRAEMRKADREMSPRLVNRIREELNLSQARFGERFGVTDRTVYGWESGKIRPGNPSRKMLWDLCEELFGKKTANPSPP